MLPPQSYIAWKVCLTFLHVLVVSSTVLRLSIRYKGRQLWWDDYVASFAMCLDTTFAIMLWLRVHSKDPNPNHILDATGTAWIQALFYFTIVWSSRVSLSLSIARIFPAGTRVRNWLLTLTFTFVLAYLTVCLLSTILCSSGIDWKTLQLDSEECQTGFGGFYISGLLSIAFEFVADILLVICPLILLWRVRLPLVERRLVLIAFSASFLTSLTAVVFCIFWYGGIDLGEDYRLLMAAVAHLQAAISVIVCNFLVDIMFFWRFWRKRQSTGPASTGAPTRTAHQGYSTTDPPYSQSVELPERGREFRCTFTPVSREPTVDSEQQGSFASLRSHFHAALDRHLMTLTSTFDSLVRHVGMENTPFRPRKSSVVQSDP